MELPSLRAKDMGWLRVVVALAGAFVLFAVMLVLSGRDAGHVLKTLLVGGWGSTTAITEKPFLTNDRTSSSAAASSGTATARSTSRVNRGSLRAETARPPISAYANRARSNLDVTSSRVRSIRFIG